jgi:Holliday junction resolvase RusA-like endonuclease
MDEPFEIERRGAAAGINPMFGDWQQRFDLEPVSYANGGNARAAFKAAVRAQLTNKFVFVGEISLRVVLYLDEQKMLETPSYGDIDNHAKQLLDTIKGHGGLLIDDCQVQHIDISWIDVPHGVHFEMAIKASPDDFMALPLRLYEMPDGLYYPLSDRTWTTEGLKPVSAEQTLSVAHALADMTRRKRTLRHDLRQAGLPQFRAFQHSKYVSPILMGFHRTRVEQSGFELVPLKAWTKTAGN